ncbi:MAG: BON domain-containing protein [Bacteroidales bacterium]
MDRDIKTKESEIREKVKRKLKRDERLFESDITVSVKGGTISLEGRVPATHALRAAENDAYTVMGVRTVENYLSIDPPSGYKQPTDLEIEESVRSTLTWNNQIDSTDIDVIVKKGIVELNGSIGSYYEMKLAEEVCSTLNGVREVINNIVVNTRHDNNDELIADNVFEALDSDPMVNSADIDIAINNGLVTLSGTVQDYASANAAHDALLYIPGLRGIVNNINIG